MANSRFRIPVFSEQKILDHVHGRPLASGDTAERKVLRELMEKHHYSGEDSSRVRNRNALLVLGIGRRAALGIYLHWRKRFKNKRQARVKDFHDAMNRFNNRLAFATIAAH